ncbi:MAG: DNA gyrase subunit B [Alphaproteobacteria bacterium MarineAlpha5_Bin7]|nr:MAG: DNA gyrase subunit B [Alphaproteobacteria bacterium MarineAlpha5_Bin7]|tara:strand:+ start:514 stop:2448 length:1935 start_codon:yes stop_codon:yes gene_type:complete
MAKKNSYTAKDIEVLEGLQPVRKRPGMYIGNTNEDGLHHLVNEVLDNSIDEVIAGYAKNISFHYSKDKSITIKDDGRGIPTDFHPKFKNKRALEIVLTTLHAGGKFSEKNYKTSGGLHGVGISVVNALSKEMEVRVYQKSKLYSQKYSRGKIKNKIKIEKCSSKNKGTEIKFIPDEDIFDNIIFSPKKLYNFIKMKSILIKGTKIIFKIDKEMIKDKTPKEEEFFYPNGIVDFFKENYETNKKIISKFFHINKNLDNNEKCEVLISFNEAEKSTFNSYCNTIETPDGGSHENALKNSILKSIKLFGQKNQISKINNININDIFDYSNTFISIFINTPSFEGQTKKRIIMPQVQKKLEGKIHSEFILWLNSNKKDSLKLIDNFIERSLLRTDLTKIKELERKTFKEKNRLPGKLVDCSSNKIEGTELFIVEGDSAGGSAKQARVREKQAILPLKGKILNVYNVSLSKIADNLEIQNIIQALGCGIGKNFQLSKLRYEKIILMTDADVDGSHISTLLITFFYKYMRNLIASGKLFLAMPPLYKIKYKDMERYAYDEKEKDRILKENSKKIHTQISRFKGLGEMPAEQLKITTMDATNRQLIKVDLISGSKEEKKTEKLFDSLMGKKAEYRFKFIQENANFIRNIDI